MRIVVSRTRSNFLYEQFRVFCLIEVYGSLQPNFTVTFKATLSNACRDSTRLLKMMCNLIEARDYIDTSRITELIRELNGIIVCKYSHFLLNICDCSYLRLLYICQVSLHFMFFIEILVLINY